MDPDLLRYVPSDYREEVGSLNPSDPDDAADLAYWVSEANLQRKLETLTGHQTAPSVPSEPVVIGTDPVERFSVPAHPMSKTEQIATVLDTFAPGEELPVSEVLETLHLFGLQASKDTLRKARQRVGIETRYNGSDGQWYWHRPA